MGEQQHEHFGAWYLDIPAARVMWSPGMYEIYGLDGAQPVRSIEDWQQLILDEDRPRVQVALQEAIQTLKPYKVRYRIHRRSDGALRQMETCGQVVVDAEGRPECMFGSTLDVTDFDEAAASLAASERLLRSIMDASPDIILVKDAEGRWRMLNRAGARLYGVEHQSWEGRSDAEMAELVHPLYREGLMLCAASDELAWQAGELTRGLERVPLPEGGERVFDIIKLPLFNEQGERSQLIVLGRDITERVKAEAELEYVATHDILTGIPNRTYFVERLKSALHKLQEGRRLAVVSLDLDHFKSLNDGYGHHVGDALLQQVSLRFQAALREHDLLVRFGGDEFGVLLDGLASADEAKEVAARLVKALDEAFEVDGLSFFLTGSAGISLAPDDAVDAMTLIRYAGSAKCRAKELGRNNYAMYQVGMNEADRERIMLLSDLRKALREGKLDLYYQPQLNLASMQVEAVEALARWPHPVFGPINPIRFITLAEESGLIHELGAWALRTACQQALDWRGRLGVGMRMAVNVSAIQIQQPGLVQLVRRVLEETELPAELLELEVTESALLKDPDQALNTMRELRALGVSVTLDDFGTGYSSLSYLKRFPFDRLKIDRGLVCNMSSDEADIAIVRAIVAMGHCFGLKVVAEGVETPEQRDCLESVGCDMLQGYLIGRPSPAAQLETLFAQSSSWASQTRHMNPSH